MSPAAVPSPDGRYLAYNLWRTLRRDDPARSWAEQGIEAGDGLAVPELRFHDLASGRDAPLAEGAYSVAWRSDGALAYARGVDPVYRAYRPYETELVVRLTLDGPERAWSSRPGRYVAVAWAGSQLIAYRLSEGESVDTLAFEGPGRERMLVEGGTLVALSPDGRHAFVEEGAGSGLSRVSVVDVSSGVRRSDLQIDGAVGYAGDWTANLVVATSGRGLSVFAVGYERIAVEQEFTLQANPTEPRFADDRGSRIVAAIETPGGPAFLDCDRAVGRCLQLRPDPTAPGVGPWKAWRRPVYNPSRPA
jgi:hypothetical protein